VSKRENISQQGESWAVIEHLVAELPATSTTSEHTSTSREAALIELGVEMGAQWNAEMEAWCLLARVSPKPAKPTAASVLAEYERREQQKGGAK
jgi:hypothetical protein